MTDRFLEAMTRSAAHRYGTERVSELAHALQCAELARDAGADEELTLACLLHDVGRFAVDQALVFDRVGGGGAGARGHHEIGADLIAPYVPERVAWLVRMHALAKRLRRWDDQAKVVGKESAPLAAWEPLLRAYFR